MSHRKFNVGRIAGALGAEVAGVDLREPLDDAAIAEIRRALLDHQVIFFRDQHLTPEQHLAFGRRFGSLNVHEFVGGMADYPEIIEVRKEPDDRGGNFGGAWHSDVTYLEEPALGSILYAREVPDFGGDTLFANMYMAYDSLSDGMKRMLDGLTAVHSARRPYASQSDWFPTQRSMEIRRNHSAQAEVEHPVVRTHPETGRKALFVNSTFTIRFGGMTEDESAPLLDYLYRHLVRPEFTCRFRWSANAVAFWDNRCVQHYAVNDYHGRRRVMHRVTVNGDRPY
jgi:alpha-ketoglutarate-dependent taurine dioxygenase